MEAEWYYARDGVQTGPVPFDELKAAVAAGKLGPGDLVWTDGMADWAAARTVPGLFTGPPPPPAPSAQPEPLSLSVGGSLPSEPEPLPLDDDYRPGRGWRGEASGAEFVALVREFFRRTVAANPAAIAVSPDEETRLTGAGVQDPVARRFAVWRRAVLWVSVLPTGFAALFGLITVIDMDKDEKQSLTGFGIFLQYIQALSLFALPVCAALAALAYDRLAASTRLVLRGGLIAFGMPILVAFVPADAMIVIETGSEVQKEVARAGAGFLLGIMFYLMLMPTVLSLLPAVSRACGRVKTFLPESLVPGWGLVASVPLCVLLTLATFVLLYHLAGNFLLMVGLLLWIGSPLLYLTQFRLLTRPVTDRRDMESLARTQQLVLAMIAGGVLLIVIYLFTAKFAGMALMGFDKDKSLFRPWNLDLHKFWIEYLGRSLFLTVLFADLMVRMALSVWREERAFAGTAGAAAFDQTMSGLGAAVAPTRPEPLP
jgi:hypothetical protein